MLRKNFQKPKLRGKNFLKKYFEKWNFGILEDYEINIDMVDIDAEKSK